MYRRRFFIACVIACLPVSMATAERVPLGPEEKKNESTDIVKGIVKGVYSREMASELYGKGTSKRIT